MLFEEKYMGTLTYQLLTDDQALVSVRVSLSDEKAKRIKKLRYQQSDLIICLDKSGSMSGSPMDWVKKSMFHFQKMIFDNQDKSHNIKMRTLLYDKEVYDVSCNDIGDFEQKFGAGVKASGGTDFSKPLAEILK